MPILLTQRVRARCDLASIVRTSGQCVRRSFTNSIAMVPSLFPSSATLVFSPFLAHFCLNSPFPAPSHWKTSATTFLLFLRVRGKAILRSDTIVPRYILGFHLFFFPSSGVAHLPTLPRLRLYSSLSSHIESGVCSLSKKNIYLYRYLYLYLSLYIYTPLPHEERKEKGGTADL